MWLALSLGCYKWYQSQPSNPVWARTYGNEDVRDLSGEDCDAPNSNKYISYRIWSQWYIEVRMGTSDALLAQLNLRPTLLERIIGAQGKDHKLVKINEAVKKGERSKFSIRSDGTLLYEHRVCVPNDGELRKEILEEAHCTTYTMHPGSTKMYRNLREHFWWDGMKNDIAQFVARCLTCQQVKIEHQRPSGLLQPLSIPQWKWEQISMDFVSGLPRTRKDHDSIWVIVDRLTKSAHFLAVKTTYSLSRLARLFVDEIVRLHGAPVSILSDRDPRFTSRFWPRLHQAMGTRLSFSTAFHPQSDGQTERTIQTLEDMLRACVLNFQGSWEEHLPLIEFAYNNSFHASIGMAPYEALYGRKCRSPVCWDEVGESRLVGPEIIQITSEKIRLIRERIQTAQSRQKSYADRRRRDLEFIVGDHVFLKVKPVEGNYEIWA
uniref:Integrase catalytic domain-containing protein n=1 Tax=Fagus sylvatica TaxID=28930 RepID=A0A2N9IIP1_FAGSY